MIDWLISKLELSAKETCSVIVCTYCMPRCLWSSIVNTVCSKTLGTPDHQSLFIPETTVVFVRIVRKFVEILPEVWESSRKILTKFWEKKGRNFENFVLMTFNQYCAVQIKVVPDTLRLADFPIGTWNRFPHWLAWFPSHCSLPCPAPSQVQKVNSPNLLKTNVQVMQWEFVHTVYSSFVWVSCEKSSSPYCVM